MSCNCKSEVEAKLLERFKASTPDGTGHQVELQGYGLGIIDNTMTVQPFMAFKGSAVVPRKKGEGVRLLPHSGSMVFSFCPFCGKSLKEAA